MKQEGKRGFYKLKSYRLSDEVIEEIEKLKKTEESYNQVFERILKIKKYVQSKNVK